MVRIGIYAGTFDPVHHGHVAFALAAARAARLSKVVIVPEPTPRHKGGVASLVDRLAMLQLATKAYPALEVAEVHDRQFSIGHTLPLLQRIYGADLALLLGSDVAKTIATWPDSGQLFAKTELIVAIRAGDDPNQIHQQLTAQGARFVCLQSPKESVSSSRIRLRRDEAEDVDSQVAAYIATNNLYTLAPTTN